MSDADVRVEEMERGIERLKKDHATLQKSFNGMAARIGKLEDELRKKGRGLSIWEAKQKIAAITEEIMSLDPAEPRNKVRRHKLFDRRAELERSLTE